jgi:hypothetical protein
MSLGTLAPYAFPQALDDNADPLDGGLLYTYAAGTSTPATTYTDADLLVANTNPIVLSAGGRYKIYLPAQSYKFVLKNSAGVVIDTTDPVGSVGLASAGVFDIFNFYGDPTSPILGTAYPLGATFDKCHAGTAWLAIDSASMAPGTYQLSGMILSTGGDLVSVAIVNLTDGAPDTPIAVMTSTSTTGTTAQSGAITFGTAGSIKTYGIKVKIDAGSGFAWAIQLVKVS